MTRQAVPVLLILAALAAPSRGAGAPTEPLVADVLRMLEAKVEERVVIAFLEGTERRPAPLTADDIIALTKAGATPAVVERLVRMGQEGAPPPPPAPTPHPQETPAPVPEPPLPAAPAPSAPAPGGTGTVEFELRFSADRQSLDEPWELYYYMDGAPMAWSRGRGGLVGRDVLQFEEKVPAGEHVVAILFERHDGRRGRHEARVCPEVVKLAVVPGERHRLRLAVKESWALPVRGGGALSWSFTGADGETAGRDDVGGDPDDWPHLCEDAEASVREGKKPSIEIRRALDGCRRWSEIWGEGATPRGQVLAELAAAEFQPVPASVR